MHSLCFLCSVLVVLVRKMPFRTASLIGLASVFIVGASGLEHLGVFGSGKIWLLTFSVLGTILYGLKAGVITAILNAIVVAVIGFLINGDSTLLKWVENSEVTAGNWSITGITFTFLNVSVVIPLALLVDALEKRLVQESRLRKEIAETYLKLEESKEKLSQAIQGSVIPTFLIDSDHVITHWNEACEKVTGKTQKEMVGTRNQWIAFGRYERPIPADLVLHKAQGKTPDSKAYRQLRPSPLIEGALEGDVIINSPDGEEQILLCTAALLRNCSGEAVGAIQTFMDITEREQVEAQLNQAKKMEAIGSLAGGVAHDFNNMLSVIIGQAELLLESVDSCSSLRDDIQAIKSAGVRSAELTRQLLTFARKQNVEPVRLDLNKALHGMGKMLSRLIGEDIVLDLVYGKDLWPVHTDRSQIDQILANLCVNARDSISGVGRITIETANVHFERGSASRAAGLSGDYVLISVKDNGCGMDSETVKRVFEPFFTTKKKGHGTGLGLSTVHGIVNQNQGQIKVFSKPGKGSEFRIYLPRYHGESSVEEEFVNEGGTVSCNETILVVEDEEVILELCSRLLTDYGYNVIKSLSPEEALETFSGRAGEIDLLLTDVVMPGMNGKELADLLLSENPDLKVLFMSGYTADIVESRGIADNRCSFLAKPFSIDELSRKVRETLDSSC